MYISLLGKQRVNPLLGNDYFMSLSAGYSHRFRNLSFRDNVVTNGQVVVFERGCTISAVFDRLRGRSGARYSGWPDGHHAD
jgi:hypothetical protein